MRHALFTLLLSVPLLAQTPAQPAAPSPAQAAAADPFAPVRFLVGEWGPDGEVRPGQPTGQASFRFELEGRALIRRGHADYPAAGPRPATHHEDFLALFVEGGQLKGFYLDNEGHVIRYGTSEVPGGVAFTSEPGPGPRFRLTYLRKAEALVALRFEIAPPGKPEAFAVYLEALTRKLK